MLACTAAGKHQVRPRGGAATEDQGWRHSASCLPILARIYGSSRSSRITSVRKCRIARAILNDPRRYRGCEQHGSEPLDTKIARPVIQTLSRQATHGLSRSPMHQHRTTAYAIHHSLCNSHKRCSFKKPFHACERTWEIPKCAVNG